MIPTRKFRASLTWAANSGDAEIGFALGVVPAARNPVLNWGRDTDKRRDGGVKTTTVGWLQATGRVRHEAPFVDSEGGEGGAAPQIGSDQGFAMFVRLGHAHGGNEHHGDGDGKPDMGHVRVLIRIWT